VILIAHISLLVHVTQLLLVVAMIQVTCNRIGLGCGWKIKFVTFVVLFQLFKLQQHMVHLNLKISKSNNSTHHKLFHMMFRTFSL
jgi:hypothetical protein